MNGKFCRGPGCGNRWLLAWKPTPANTRVGGLDGTPTLKRHGPYIWVTAGSWCFMQISGSHVTAQSEGKSRYLGGWAGAGGGGCGHGGWEVAGLGVAEARCLLANGWSEIEGQRKREREK